MSAANELLMAVHARLSGDTGLSALVGADGVRDRLIAGRKMPCIVIGEMTSGAVISGEAGEEHLFSLEICAEDGGRRVAGEIAGIVAVLLDGAGLSVAGHHLVTLQHRLTRSRREAKTRMYVAEMRFRAVTEPAQPA
jgi:hypothetical protein